MYCSSFKQHQSDLVPRQGGSSERTRRGQLLSGLFSKHLEKVARLPSLFRGDWDFFKIPQRSSSRLKEACRGSPDSFSNYFPASAHALQAHRSELITKAGMHSYFSFINIYS